ncbi:uncharacterized protein LOC122371686 [Amphibalanus amphitrite]|uniref:uncharacterized protein LOC122371686 n=1 Tax=Amphibalanus amphitrite TaxID=1232801 RepID=UPI001C912C65|nr:uncharacterized protein LOC122371686 [Amphibalanus amphitrite]
MSCPRQVLGALFALAAAAAAGRLPSTLRLDQLERTRLSEPRLGRVRLDEPRLVAPQLEEAGVPLEEEPALWSAEPTRREQERELDGAEDRLEQDGGEERLRRNRHRKRKRPSAEHLLYLRSRDSTCPRSASGEEQFFCASHHPSGERACVGMARLCDGVPDCPEAEDELAVACLFYKALSHNLEKMTGKVLQLTAHHRHRLR